MNQVLMGIVAMTVLVIAIPFTGCVAAEPPLPVVGSTPAAIPAPVPAGGDADNHYRIVPGNTSLRKPAAGAVERDTGIICISPAGRVGISPGTGHIVQHSRSLRDPVAYLA